MAARSVRAALVGADPEELARLAELFTVLQKAHAIAPATVQEALRLNQGRFPRFEEWAAANPGMLIALLVKALPIFFSILSELVQQVSDEEHEDAYGPGGHGHGDDRRQQE